MRAIVVDSFGSPDVLNFQDLPDPTPPPGGYVVQVVASSINYADVVDRRGLYRKDQQLPSRLGKEAAGVVIARDCDAVEFEVGDPVIIVCLGNGCYAEQVAVEAHEVLPPPRGLSFVEMASFAITYTTAWYGMFEIANVRRGEAVLIQAAAGGVGTAAIDLARSNGCGLIIGTAGGPAKCATAVAHGADACVDYTTSDFRPTVLELTGGTGVDYCLESVGGESYARAIDVMAPMGHLVIIGFSSIGADYANEIRRVHPLTLFQRSISIGGLNLDNLAFAQRRGLWGDLVAHTEQHGIRPLVTQVYPFEQIRQAHQALETRQTTGKVALVMDPRALDVPTGRSTAVLV
jgi:NADPH:quinone reductase-like Zn-dependent oxidoreductase